MVVMRVRSTWVRPFFMNLLVASVVAAAGAVVAFDVVTDSAAAAVAPCKAEAGSEGEALTAAAVCNRPVVVGASRSEYVQVVAQPDGRLRFESAVEPQRARRSDGSWATYDAQVVEDAQP